MPLAKGQWYINGNFMFTNGMDCKCFKYGLQGLQCACTHPAVLLHTGTTSTMTIREVEQLLGEFANNFATVDTTFYIKTDHTSFTSLVVYTNLVLIQQLFTEVQNDSNTDLTFTFLLQLALTMSNITSTYTLFDNVQGEQTYLVSHSFLNSLNKIFQCIGKEVFDPDTVHLVQREDRT